MCQKLVDRVAQSQQLMAVADPELLVLFEDWLDFVKLDASVGSGVAGDAQRSRDVREQLQKFVDAGQSRLQVAALAEGTSALACAARAAPGGLPCG